VSFPEKLKHVFKTSTSAWWLCSEFSGYDNSVQLKAGAPISNYLW